MTARQAANNEHPVSTAHALSSADPCGTGSRDNGATWLQFLDFVYAARADYADSPVFHAKLRQTYTLDLGHVKLAPDLQLTAARPGLPADEQKEPHQCGP